MSNALVRQGIFVSKQYQTLSCKWWYQNSNGSYPKNAWKKISGAWYHFNAKGYMQTGWQKIGGKWYYLGTDGKMATGWKQIASKWYYMDSSGAMKTGWLKSGGKWYFLAKSGAMATNKWQGNYYLQGDGSMATKRWVGAYYVGNDGAWVKQAKGESKTGVGSNTLRYENKYFAIDFPSSWKGKWTVTGYVDELRPSIGLPNYTYIIYVGDKQMCLIHAHLYNIGSPQQPETVVTSSDGYSVYLFDKGALSSNEKKHIEKNLSAR